MYLPFIKLTTTQKIFSEEGTSLEQTFLRNLKVLGRYRESIERLQGVVRVNVFEVDCTAPIATLQERIKEIEYIIEQNYLNIIHEKIEEVESELGGLKLEANNMALNPVGLDRM